MEQTMETETKKEAKDFVQVGQILYTCWGYDQTNTEFFKVVKILGKRYVSIVEMPTHQIEGSQWAMGASIVPGEATSATPQKAYIDEKGYMHVCEKGYQRSLRVWAGQPASVSWGH